MTFTAADAAKMAQDALSLDGPYGREQTERQIGAIKAAAQSGLRQTTMVSMASEYRSIVVKRLEALGFKVLAHTGRDPEDHYTSISW